MGDTIRPSLTRRLNIIKIVNAKYVCCDFQFPLFVTRVNNPNAQSGSGIKISPFQNNGILI